MMISRVAIICEMTLLATLSRGVAAPSGSAGALVSRDDLETSIGRAAQVVLNTEAGRIGAGGEEGPSARKALRSRRLAAAVRWLPGPEVDARLAAIVARSVDLEVRAHAALLVQDSDAAEAFMAEFGRRARRRLSGLRGDSVSAVIRVAALTDHGVDAYYSGAAGEVAEQFSRAGRIDLVVGPSAGPGGARVVRAAAGLVAHAGRDAKAFEVTRRADAKLLTLSLAYEFEARMRAGAVRDHALADDIFSPLYGDGRLKAPAVGDGRGAMRYRLSFLIRDRSKATLVVDTRSMDEMFSGISAFAPAAGVHLRPDPSGRSRSGLSVVFPNARGDWKLLAAAFLPGTESPVN